MDGSSNGHAFICYVREDSDAADKLQEILTAAGIPIWRDTESLWPGQDWRERIRDAITRGAFAFIPIFTATSYAKGVSGQNEELYLAAEEMRRRPPGSQWILPVRFDDCQVPALNLGGGRVLSDIQRSDLFGSAADRNADRLVAVVREIFESRSVQAASVPQVERLDESTAADRLDNELKAALRDPAGDIRLYDLMMPVADAVFDELASLDVYPVSGSVDARAIADQVNSYWRDLHRLIRVMITAGTWSRSSDEPIWAEVFNRVARSCGLHQGGNVARLRVRWFPLLPLVYAIGISSVKRGEYGSLRAAAMDAHVRDGDQRVPIAARVDPWWSFQELPLAAEVLALEASGEIVSDDVIEDLRSGRKGKRYTPVSDYLHDRMRESFQQLVPDDDDYSDLFDRFEVLINLVQMDTHLQVAVRGEGSPWRYAPRPNPGRFTWRSRRRSPEAAPERVIQSEFEGHGSEWAPLRADLFGGSSDRVRAAFEAYLPLVDEVRNQRW